MKTNRLFLIAALLGTVLAGCQKEEVLIPEEKPEVTPGTEQYLSLKVQANLAAETKALDLVDGKLKTTWRDGEKVAVYFGGEKIGTLEVENADNAAADLSGRIMKVDGLGNGSALTLLFPGRDDEEWTYQGQDGSAPSALSSLSTGFDYETATVTLSNVDNDPVTATGAVFASEQSMFRFAFKVGDDPTLISVSSFIVSSEQNKIVRNRSLDGNWQTKSDGYGSLTVMPTSTPAGNLYYMSIRNEYTTENVEGYDRFYFSVTGEDKTLYLGSKKIPQNTLGFEKFIGATVKLTQANMTPNSETTTDTAL